MAVRAHLCKICGRGFLSTAIDKGYRSVTIHSDSQFVQDAITGSETSRGFFRQVLSKNQVTSVQVYEPNQDSLSP
ncbi:Protein CBG11645 [Caenorhabditis briggsae]|uniref:Protein CBG11645 n=1 Tax=Caenorhabditis briggsae TaxID=6238 RepID=A8XDP9_CAEBR|nr:Protein CBG11645 [Caenorhabditis briggsae]CAP30769.2 Protein CBG11645 [Caenorhabditis briggsae]